MWKWIKEENGGEAILINGWADGIAQDPYSGMGAMLSVDLEVPGEVAVGYPVTANTLSGGGSSLGNPIARSTRYFTTYATPPASGTGLPVSYAILDANGRVWEATTYSGTFTFLSSSNSVTNSSSRDGVTYYLGYLFKTRDTAVDIWNGSTWYKVGWDPTTGGTGGTPLKTGVKHFMFVSQNNSLYITNGYNLASITPVDVATFDPANTATYTFSALAISAGLPITDTAISLAEIGGGNAAQSTLLIGGSQSLVYPWDKISLSYANPIYVAEPYIVNLVSANQNAFIFTGNPNGDSGSGRGRIYITNGSQADEWFKIPDFIFGVQEPYFVWGDGIFLRNNLVLGFIVTRNGTGFPDTSQVWAIDFSTKKFRAISNLPAVTGIGIARVLIPNGTSGMGFSYIAGWDDKSGTTFVISNSSTQVGTGTGTVVTDLIPIGTFLVKHTPSQVEFKLRTPLAAGESISITPIVDSVTGSALTFSPTVTTGSISGVAPVNFTGAQWLQFSVSLTGNSNSSGCRLVEIRIR